MLKRILMLPHGQDGPDKTKTVSSMWRADRDLEPLIGISCVVCDA